ncbi:MAG: hypothetical protein IT425_10840 [Pirellulales bacterium]|nr:hypothetical protein [Pirellulales bacterium]
MTIAARLTTMPYRELMPSAGNYVVLFGVLAMLSASAASVASAAVPSTAFASTATPTAAAIYDRGVNAFFTGDYAHAEMFLSEAIQRDGSDPRSYYFRGLSLLRQGRPEEARGDMMVGATLEAQRPQRFAVGHALERVQGGDRLLLERHRQEARQPNALQAATAQGANTPGLPPRTFAPGVPTQTLDAVEAAVLRERRIVPLEELLRPGGPQAFAEELPQATKAKSSNTSATQPPRQSANSTQADPFGDDASNPPAGVASPPVTPPQPTPPAVPPTTPPATPPQTPPATPPAEIEQDPFGG